MPGVNRDLLLLTDAAGQLTPEAFAREVQFLNRLLFRIENWECFCVANELIDINRRKIIHKTFLIQKILSEPKLKPFVFTCNKN